MEPVSAKNHFLEGVGGCTRNLRLGGGFLHPPLLYRFLGVFNCLFVCLLGTMKMYVLCCHVYVFVLVLSVGKMKGGIAISLPSIVSFPLFQNATLLTVKFSIFFSLLIQ